MISVAPNQLIVKGFIKESLDCEQYFFKPWLQSLFLIYLLVNKNTFSASVLSGVSHALPLPLLFFMPFYYALIIFFIIIFYDFYYALIIFFLLC